MVFMCSIRVDKFPLRVILRYFENVFLFKFQLLITWKIFCTYKNCMYIPIKEHLPSVRVQGA